ncbi:MAG: T9SS type A sorting domain-containing protein, partial [Flavobacteriaceae bacterium]
GGILIITVDVGDSNAYIRNCIIRNNYAVNEGGGIFVSKRAEIYNCKIYSNQTDNSGGGISISTNGRIYNSYVVNNKSVNFGGGIKITGINSAPKVINCVIANNECENYGAGAYLSEGYLNNCTIVNNGGNGVHFGSYGSTFNGIIWGNSTYQSTHIASNNSHQIENNIIQDISTIGTNIGISSANNGAIYGENYPRFTKPTTFTGNATTPEQLDEILNADWYINPQSAAIDFGDNSSYPVTTDTPIVDIIGNNRTINTTMDAGAFEALTNVVTNEATNQQPTSADLNGEVLFAETSNTIQRGFVYATTENFDVTTATSITNSSNGIGTYTDNITSLIQNQFYYYKTWVQFDGVKYYGAEKLFNTSNLVAYYPFNGNANDESGNENHGNVSGSTLTIDRFGNLDSAYEFNGIDNFVQVANSSSLDITSNELTINMWLYNDNPDSSNLWKGISKGGYDTGNGYELIFTNDPSNINGRLSLNIGGGGYFISDFNSYNNQWIMITGTFNNGVGEIYINGIEQSKTQQGTINLISSTSDLFIGRRNPANNYAGFVKGKIDDVRIYSTELSVTQILNLFNNNALIVEKYDTITKNKFYVNNNILYFKSTQNLTEINNIEVYNLLGQQVFETSKIEKEISLEPLKLGVYILKVTNNSSHIQTLRFLIY